MRRTTTPREYADKYKGKFDDGYEAYRAMAAGAHDRERRVARGHSSLHPSILCRRKSPIRTRGNAVRPWDTLNANEKKLFARMAEVYAGFSQYTDVQVGRIIEYLENTNQLDNTIIFYCADNGASGEGSPNGSVNKQVLQRLAG